MPQKRFLKLLPVVLALVMWAGTASATAITAATPANLTYTTSVTNVATTSSVVSGGDGGAITVGTIVYVSGANWITSALATGTLTTSGLVTVLLNTATAATMGAGTYTATIPLTDVALDTGTFTVTLVITSPVSATTASTTMLSVLNQAPATYVDTVVSVDAAYDVYTVTAASCPVYLTWASTHTPTLEAKSGLNGPDVLTFTLSATGQVANSSVTTCVVTLKYNTVSFAVITFSSLTIVATQPLMITTAPVALGFNKGTGLATTGTSTALIKSTTGLPSITFNLDLATVPPWLTLSAGLTSNSANTAGATGDLVTFIVNTSVAAGMATGNYTAQVGFFQTGAADLLVPFTLAISNATPSVTVTPNAAVLLPFTSSMSVPQPTAALYSTGDPVAFTATCSAVPTGLYLTRTTGFSAAGCLLNGTVASGATTAVNGTAFTWGFPMTVTLDPLLFAATVPIGNTVTVNVTFSALSGGITAPTAVSYVYTIQPGPIANPLTVGPTSVAAGFKTSGSSFVVLVKGNNFVGPGSLIPSSTVVDTQVWLGTPPVLLTNANAGTLGSYVVLDASRMQVTILGTALPALVAGKAGALVIGAANQTGPLAPTVATGTASLTVTLSPVVYGMTSTASYNQPAVGASPSFAPYEFISLFGDNFGFTGLTNTSANASYDTYGKIVTPMTLGTPSGAGAKPVTLAVTFKDVATGKISFSAAVEFANQNQINALVPAGVAGDQNVTVTSGGLTSDNFLVHVVPADPGIFTLNSDGAGGGAIVNASGTVNGLGQPALASSTISIYLAGLGVPDSTGLDAATANVTNYPVTCVSIAGTALAPGLMTVKNLKVTSPAYTGPGWTNIDGAVMNYGVHDIIAGNTGDLNYPPCMATATIAVTFGTPGVNSITVTGTGGVGGIAYAGFVSGSVAGLYQINVAIPASLTGAGSAPAALTGATPVSVTITPALGSPYTSQSGVTIVF